MPLSKTSVFSHFKLVNLDTAMMQAAAEKLVSVIGHWLPFPFRQQQQQQQQQRIFFYDEADDNDMWVICPFKNCLGYLLNDGFQTVIDAECPICHRLFCARCKVPWHAGETCQQFQHNKLKYEILDSCENHDSKKRKSPFGDEENLTRVSQSKSSCRIRKSAHLGNESPSPPPVQEDLVQSCILGWQKTTYCPFKNSWWMMAMMLLLAWSVLRVIGYFVHNVRFRGMEESTVTNSNNKRRGKKQQLP